MAKQSVPSEFDESGFEAFWKSYPRREARKDAYKAWRQLQPDDATKEHIHVALLWQCQQRGWQQSTEFIPLPATWLRGERWHDERRCGPDRRLPAVQGWACAVCGVEHPKPMKVCPQGQARP